MTLCITSQSGLGYLVQDKPSGQKPSQIRVSLLDSTPTDIYCLVKAWPDERHSATGDHLSPAPTDHEQLIRVTQGPSAATAPFFSLSWGSY